MIPISISVKAVIGNTLNTRDEAAKLFEFAIKQYPTLSNLVFEFYDVDFMSRSFADQFHKEKIKLATEHKTNIEIDNANAQIIEILQAVANTQNGNRMHRIQQIDVLSFTDTDYLYKYLMAV